MRLSKDSAIIVLCLIYHKTRFANHQAVNFGGVVTDACWDLNVHKNLRVLMGVCSQKSAKKSVFTIVAGGALFLIVKVIGANVYAGGVTV